MKNIDIKIYIEFDTFLHNVPSMVDTNVILNS